MAWLEHGVRSRADGCEWERRAGSGDDEVVSVRRL